MNQGSCIIVGVGPGLGLSLARRFGAAGHPLVLVARDPARLSGACDELAAASLPAASIAADAADPAALAAALSRVTDTECLIYNAALLEQGQPSRLSPAALARHLAVDVVGAHAAALAVLPAMRARGSGTILFTGGGFALSPQAPFAGLSVGKAALRALALVLAQELSGEGIHVASVTVRGLIAPGTPFDPDLIAERFLAVARQPQPSWEAEILFG